MTIKIAIAGGGISGLCLARGLSRHPNFKVTVYEAVHKYLDVGGAIAFHGNAIRALHLIDPELHDEYFRRATDIGDRDKEIATQVMVGDSDELTLLAELGKAKGRKAVARGDLLEGLLSLAPEGMVRFGKRLAKVEERTPAEGESILLQFKDGSTATADVLIGCDGVHSVVRKYLLGPDHPAVGPKNHDGWQWVTRNMPAEEVLELNGGLLDYIPIFCGYGSFMVSGSIHYGKTLFALVAQIGKDFYATSDCGGDGVQKVPDPVSMSDFLHWTKNARDLAALVLRDPITTWKLADHDPAPFYSCRNICMIGDAAHATMPFAGQGAAQAVEDVALIAALFAQVKDLGQVEKALQLYDEFRRPRSQKVVELSRAFGRMYAFVEKDVGSDVDKLRAKLGAGAKYINEVDLEGMHQQAVKKLLEPVF